MQKHQIYPSSRKAKANNVKVVMELVKVYFLSENGIQARGLHDTLKEFRSVCIDVK